MTEHELAASLHLERMTALGAEWLEAKAAGQHGRARALHEAHEDELRAFRRAEKKARRDARRAA